MRTITQHIYKSKSSAMRAAKNAVGQRYLVEDPELKNRFDGEIVIGLDMVFVFPCEGGWKWGYTFYLDDVIVRVLRNGTPEEARYADVAHWANATTPPAAEPAAVPLTLSELAKRIEFYKESVKSIAASKDNEAVTAYINRELPQLKAACETFGVTVSDVGEVLVMVKNATKSTDPYSIARVMLKAEPYGLHGRLEQQLYEHAKKRGLSVAYCMQSAREHLQSCAV